MRALSGGVCFLKNFFSAIIVSSFYSGPPCIGAGASIGSNCVLVAPVSVGEGAVVGASSAITRDVSPDALALERSEQTELADGGRRFRERRDKPPKGEAEPASDKSENESET